MTRQNMEGVPMRVREMVDLVASESPPPRYTVDEIVESGRRVQRRRRQRWAASGAAALAVLGVTAAVAVPSLVGGAASPTVAAGQEDATALTGQQAGAAGAAYTFPAGARPFTFTFDGYQVGRLRVGQPIDVSTAYELAPVYADGFTTNDRAVDPDQPPAAGGPTLYAYLAVYRPGAYDPAKLAGARQVTVAGRPGLEASGPGLGNIAVTRTLAWQYDTDGWAVITAHSGDADAPSADELRQLAAGLRAGTPEAARVPVTLGYVPSGYHLTEVAMHAMTGLNGIASARDGDHAGLLLSRPALPTTGLTEPYGGVDGAEPPGSFLVFVLPAANSNQPPQSAGISCRDDFCNRWVEDGAVKVQVVSRGPDGLPQEEMTKILDGITLANVRDDSTWTEAGAAIS
ncbi:hypothetical protein ACN27G_16440 [Plantactinospora sp. WMMB334]|uniref:hypothetical protein n=1 Tax=Plantactinospora sp. WMMB334 TaxID=3404119 RepID=UPI003B954C3F